MSKYFHALAKLVVHKGLQTGPFGSQLKAEEYTDTGIPVIMPKDIYAGKITTKTIAKTSVEKSKSLKKHLLLEGDILFPRRGDLGRIAVASKENEGWICGTGCLRARLKSDVFSGYIHQFVQMPQVVRWLENNALGQTMLNLNTTIIGELPVYAPPIKEQKAIYMILHSWDVAIETTETLIALKSQIRESFANKLLFGEHRTLAPRPPVISQNSKWFKAPNDWPITKLKHVADEVVERNASQSKYTVLSCSKHVGFVESLKYFKKKVYSDNTENYKIIRRGEFGYPSNHIEEGSIGLQNICDIGVVSPIYTVFRVNEERVNPDYLYKLLKTNLYRHIFQASTSSSVDRRGSLRWKEFSKIEIPLPSIEEQTKIANTINVFDKEIVILKELLEKYRLQKRGLMQKLLTGEWQVPSPSNEEILKEVKT